jgi:hypothetical protein
MRRKCFEEGCTKDHYARGLCAMHYQRIQKSNAPLPPLLRKKAHNVGDTIGKLVIIAPMPKPDKLMCERLKQSAWWECLCSCGDTAIKSSMHLRFTASCGRSCRGKRA